MGRTQNPPLLPNAPIAHPLITLIPPVRWPAIVLVPQVFITLSSSGICDGRLKTPFVAAWLISFLDITATDDER